MIKSIVTISIILSLIGIFTNLFPEVPFIIVGIKSEIIYWLGLLFSKLTITVVFFEVAWVVVNKFLRKL